MAALSVPAVLGLVGMIILVGLAGEWLFKKSGVPSALILIGLGVLLGPILGFVSPSSMTAAAPFFGTLALLIILFDGGLNLKIIKVLREAPFAILYTTVVFAGTVTAVSAVYHVVFGGSWLLSILLGVILGGTTGAVVIPVVANMKSLAEETRILLSLESAFTDVFVVVAALIVTNLIIEPAALDRTLLPVVMNAFLTALLLALVAGVIWSRFMGMLQGQALSYMLTLSAVLLLYSTAEAFGANGAITILFFGLVLGNMEEVVARSHQHVRRLIGWNLDVANFAIDVFLRRLNEELSFLVRTFFYVLLGLIFDVAQLSPQVAAGSLLIFLAILGTRWALTEGLGFVKSSWSPPDRGTIVAMLPRGLSAAVMAFVPTAQGVEDSEDFPLFALLIIGLSIVYMTVSLYQRGRRESRPVEVVEAPEEPESTEAEPSDEEHRAPPFLVFTGLDGSLLDQSTGRFDAARKSLHTLQQQGIPLILCSGKTRAETEHIRREIGNRDPFIVENGGAVYIPEGYYPSPPAGSITKNGYHILSFGVPYSRLREALRSIEADVDEKLRGFGDMTIDDITEATGLPQHDAERARQREYDEPFMLADGREIDPDTLARIREAAAQRGLTVYSGFRFVHLLGGTDTRRACSTLVECYRKAHGSKIRTVGFGSSAGDLAILESVDRPFVIPGPNGAVNRRLSRVEGVTRVTEGGPAGWAEAAQTLLAELEPPPGDRAQES